MTTWPALLQRQRDPRWSGLMLGYNTAGTRYTLGGYGCLLTCLANVCGVRVDALNEEGIRNGCFEAGTGNALTFAPQRWHPGTPWEIEYVSRSYPDTWFPGVELARLRGHLNGGGLAILEVQWPKTFGQHFILALAMPTVDSDPRMDPGTIIIHDPERSGPVEEMRAFYGDPKVAIVRSVLLSPAVPSTPARGWASALQRLAQGAPDPSPNQVLTDNGGGE